MVGPAIRRKFDALSLFCDGLCGGNAVLHNPIRGVMRQTVDTLEGKTPALIDRLQEKRPRLILAMLVFDTLRRKELSKMRVNDFPRSIGVAHRRVQGKDAQWRFIPNLASDDKRDEAGMHCRQGH